MKRILLADDNEDLLSALRLLLETRLGVEVISEARDMQHVLSMLLIGDEKVKQRRYRRNSNEN